MGKSVLMLCSAFFSYRETMARELREQGYAVDLYDERPGTDAVSKAMIRMGWHCYAPILAHYYRQIIQENTQKAYDEVFVVKGEAVTVEVISMLRAAFPKARFVLYLWDSVENIPACRERMRQYDKVLAFDPADAQTYGLLFRPMFYAPEDVLTGDASQEYEYDVTFIGTAHSIRPRVVKQVEALCRARGLRCFTYFYSPHILAFLYQKLRNPGFCLRWKEVHQTPLSAQEVREIYRKSRCILDVAHTRQRGLTTRPFEMLAMGRKVMTTSSLIRQYDFFNEQDFCVIDPAAPTVDERFLRTPYQPVPREVLERYSIGAFIRDIFAE